MSGCEPSVKASDACAWSPRKPVAEPNVPKKLLLASLLPEIRRTSRTILAGHGKHIVPNTRTAFSATLLRTSRPALKTRTDNSCDGQLHHLYTDGITPHPEYSPSDRVANLPMMVTYFHSPPTHICRSRCNSTCHAYACCVYMDPRRGAMRIMLPSSRDKPKPQATSDFNDVRLPGVHSRLISWSTFPVVACIYQGGDQRWSSAHEGPRQWSGWLQRFRICSGCVSRVSEDR